MRIVLATNNFGKLREFRDLLGPLGFEIEPLSQFTRINAEETGLSFIDPVEFDRRVDDRPQRRRLHLAVPRPGH